MVLVMTFALWQTSVRANANVFIGVYGSLSLLKTLGG